MHNQLLPRESKNALAVIMISGAVELEQRMQTDQQWTMSLLERDLNFMREQCTYYQGQVVKFTELGLVAMFADAIEAVKCALDIQKTLIRAASTMQPRDVLAHSIGMHWGDLVINGTEVSGTPVNIATQLQLDANWGTIHISESIYHQLNSLPDLIANYVGERYLQKIYQILPEGFNTSIPIIYPLNVIDIDAIPIHEAASPEFVEPAWHLFDQVINQLEIDQNIIEIKQLLLYVCLNKWESDRSKLEKLNLKGLVQELIELTGTLAQLKSLISEATQTVEAHYELVGEIIIQAIAQLFPNPEPQDIYDEVVQSLEDIDKDTIRIKRLLFYLCKYDLPHLDLRELSLRMAIAELQNLYPSLEALRNRMKQALNIINKPEYSAIMDVVIDELSAIFPARSLNAPTSLEPLSQFPHASFTTSSIEPYIDNSSTPENQKPSQDLVAINAKSSDHSAETIDSAIALLDLFDLRLEIIKYLSPLRAKILIFSTLNSVAESTNESISAIRTFELDDLLRDILYAYKSPEELNAHLKSTAKQFKDVDEYEQAASVIMNSVKPIYKKLGIGV